MGSLRTIMAISLVLASPAVAVGQVAGQPAARTIVIRALDLMGGAAVGQLRTVRLDMMTQWQRTGYRDVPGTDRPSFEAHVDVRDYSIPAWRNTRDFGARSIVNIVRDSVATTDFGRGAQPQSVAYFDEREELFTYTPDRLVLALSRGEDLREVGDTVIGGERHRRVRATVGPDIDATVAFHAGTGLPTLLSFRRGHPNDFGLVPFGDMDVRVWYSGWRTFGEISIPTQWDIYRAGAPYKRMTVRNATFGPTFAPDSFAVPDELRVAYLEARAPMHDRPIDSVTVVAPGLVRVHGFGFPEGAVRLGGEWFLVQAGHAPLNLDRALRALEPYLSGAPAAALVASARPGNGGVVELAADGVPIYTSAAAAPFLRVMLADGEVSDAASVRVVEERVALDSSGDVLILEPIDLPDTPGSVVVYAPRLRWLYAPDALTPLDLRLVRERAATRGWTVELLGTTRGLVVEDQPLPGQIPPR